ncbi:wee1-like protein kinase [Argentina anserina]|uniref:wee1-like protein kinase n=1 Tax=Argentina anserina TaxID=57926 RepID=UPI00217685C8|nr:wee1-like protein kinase [Potentilla anserina]
MSAMKGPLERLHLSESPHQSSFTNSDPARFQSLLDSGLPSSSALGADVDPSSDDKDGILSQDFFCTPDYITPENQNTFNGFDCTKENIPCPKSPEKTTAKCKRRRQGHYVISSNLSPTLFGNQELGKDAVGIEDIEIGNTSLTEVKKTMNYVSQSAVALRCRVMPPPCLKNPYLKDASQMEIDPFGNQRSKCAAFLPAMKDGNGLSRYRADFHEIEQIGVGNFSHVFKVLNRIDGCLYAVKQSIRQLHLDTERRKALMEVQCLAALGSHANVVGYCTSWFENEKLYIQMELCDHSLCVNNLSRNFTEGEVLVALYQIAKALQFMHERGIAHLDVKPDNIYVKNGIYKLGDFGCATLLDKSLPIEEGDARYMPSEILNEIHDNLDKADIFSLGVAIYELIRGSPLPVDGPQTFNLKKGKLPLLPSYSLQFQNLLKAMLDPNPNWRPSAKGLVENAIFHRVREHARA